MKGCDSQLKPKNKALIGQMSRRDGAHSSASWQKDWHESRQGGWKWNIWDPQTWSRAAVQYRVGYVVREGTGKTKGAGPDEPLGPEKGLRCYT